MNISSPLYNSYSGNNPLFEDVTSVISERDFLRSQTANLSAVNKTTDKILSNLAIHLKSSTELMLMIYNCAGIISTFLKFIHCESSLILSVSFASNEARMPPSCGT